MIIVWNFRGICQKIRYPGLSTLRNNKYTTCVIVISVYIIEKIIRQYKVSLVSLSLSRVNIQRDLTSVGPIINSFSVRII